MFKFHVHTRAGIIVTMILIFTVYSLVKCQTVEVLLLKPALGFILQCPVSFKAISHSSVVDLNLFFYKVHHLCTELLTMTVHVLVAMC